ncbi:MAG TPA: hypothetical protein PLI74_10165 [Candidatus Kapabacteria bacterium]|jgi:hypothetical protein|nr:hypothetical protein [Candidatus Kapabacteria bacterium]
MKIIGVSIVFIFLLYGCDVFTTRTPENPLNTGGIFTPPTSASLVIENLLNAIKEKNTENYVLCLADTSRNARQSFRYYPSSDVSARFFTLFSQWSLTNERQYILSLFSKLPNDEIPVLSLTKNRFDVITPDSAIFVSDYELTANHSVTSAPTKVKGILRLTLIPDRAGLWSISRWTDGNIESGSELQSTWSELKAQFSN